MTAPEYRDKPRAGHRSLFDAIAEIRAAMRIRGDGEEAMSRVVRGVVLAALGLPARPAVPAAAPARTGGEEVTEEDWKTGGS